MSGKYLLDTNIVIATISIQYDLILVSRDRHFNHIKNLSLEAWT